MEELLTIYLVDCGFRYGVCLWNMSSEANKVFVAQKWIMRAKALVL